MTMRCARREWTQVVDIRETEREFQADMPHLEPLDMNMDGATLECARSPSYLSVGPRRLEATGVEEITYTRNKHFTHHAAHTTETAP